MSELRERVARAIQKQAQEGSGDSPVDYGDAEALADAAIAIVLEAAAKVVEDYDTSNDPTGNADYMLEKLLRLRSC